MKTTKKDYMLTGNGPFFNWQHNFIKQILMAYSGVDESTANAIIAGTQPLPAGPHPWNIPQSEIQDLLASVQSYEPAYQKGTDINNRSSKEVEKAKLEKARHRKICRSFVNSDLRYNKLVTNDIKQSLNITVPKTTRTRHTGKIQDVPVTNAHGTGGGAGQYTCRTQDDASKPSMPADADRIEARAKLIEQPRVASAAKQTQPQPAPAPLPVPVPADPASAPQSAEECPLYFDSTKSIFEHDFGQENKGKQVVTFLRYADSKHPERSGKWSEPVVFTLI